MISGFDIPGAYRAMAAQLTKLAGEAGAKTARLGRSGLRSAFAAARTADDAAALALHRRRLYDAFMFANEFGQVEVALSLLKAGIPAKYLQAILATGHAEQALSLRRQDIAAKPILAIVASMPGSGTSSTGLAKRIAAYRATLTDGQPPTPQASATPRMLAAQIIQAYDRAIGRKPGAET